MPIAACSGGTDEAAKEAAVAEVTTAKVSRGDISQTLSVSATVAGRPNEDVKVASLTPGRVANVRVAEGDRVTKGEVLAELDPAPLQEQLRQAEAAQQQANANAENAKLSLDRNQGLFEKGIASRKEVEDARTQLAVNQGALKQAEAALSVARMQMGRARITAPINGTVVKRFVSAGEQVDGTAATPVVEVANLELVELQANVPAADLGRLRTGQKVSVPSGDKPLEGTIIATSPAVDPTSGLGLVRISVSNAGDALRLGQVMNLDVPVRTDRNVLLIPAQALYRDQENKTVAYRVNSGTVEVVEVEPTLQTKDQVEITSGLKEGDVIVLTGGYGLEDKAKVRVKQ